MNNQLTIHELRAYQAGQLDGPARHRVERLLLEDPFYADALEGLEALQRTGASLPRQTAQLRRALHERINESATERRLFPLWVTTMAASIVLVMGVALYFIYTTKPITTAVTKSTISIHSEPIVVEMGSKDSAINKTVETVAVLEAHTARLRTENSIVGYSRPVKRGLVSSQAKAYAEGQTAQTPDAARRSSITVADYSSLNRTDVAGAAFTVSAPGKLAEKKVVGTVTDQQGTPLPGVQVMVKGTNQGTTTNATGQFFLDSILVAGQLLQVAYVGFKAQEFNSLALRNGSIQLAEDTQVLNEVVVTGYGGAKTQKSGSSQPVKAQAAMIPTPGKLPVDSLNVKATVFVTELKETEVQSFRDYLKKEAGPYFQGPLSVRVYTEADGSVRKVRVQNGIRIQEPGQKRATRSYVPTSEVRAEAERLAGQYSGWPKKRQSLLWITGFGVLNN